MKTNNIMKIWIGTMIAGSILVIGFFGWIIIKLLQHFGVI